MKKVLAIVLALVFAFSAFTMAFAEEAAPANSDLAAAADENSNEGNSGLLIGTDLLGSIRSILDKITGVFSNNGDLLAQIQGIINTIKEFIANFTGTGSADVLGIVDQLEAKIGSFTLASDILSYVKGLITNLKQKIKDLYAGNRETEVIEESTAAEAPSDTGSSSVAGIAAFAAVSVAAAAAYVCTKKRA